MPMPGKKNIFTKYFLQIIFVRFVFFCFSAACFLFTNFSIDGICCHGHEAGKGRRLKGQWQIYRYMCASVNAALT